jgi:ferredoxin
MAKILPKNSASMFTATPYADMSICNQCGVCAKLCLQSIKTPTLFISLN